MDSFVYANQIIEEELKNWNSVNEIKAPIQSEELKLLEPYLGKLLFSGLIFFFFSINLTLNEFSFLFFQDFLTYFMIHMLFEEFHLILYLKS